jgi:hypothetical protein
VTEVKPFLLAALQHEREHVLATVEGLSDEQMREAKLPSGWTCLGMLKHLALGVERYWFAGVFAGEETEFFDSEEMRDQGDWRASAGDTGDGLRALYRNQGARSDEIIEGLSLDATPVWRDAWWGEWDPGDLFQMLVHVIDETATHAGHLDAVRELIDGHQHLVL